MCREILENVLSGIKAGFKAILNFEHAIERKKMDHQKSNSTLSATLMSLKKIFAPLVGLTVADVVSAAKIRFAPRRVNHSKNPQIKEVNMSILKKLVASIARLNPAGSWSAAKMQSLLLTFTLVVTAFWVSQAAMAAEKKMVTDPTTGEMVTAPEYGGTLTYVRKQVGEHTDVYFIGGWASHFISGVLEKLSIADWGIDRDVVDWKTTYIPFSGLKGAAGGKLVATRPADLCLQNPPGRSLA